MGCTPSRWNLGRNKPPQEALHPCVQFFFTKFMIMV